MYVLLLLYTTDMADLILNCPSPPPHSFANTDIHIIVIIIIEYGTAAQTCNYIFRIRICIIAGSVYLPWFVLYTGCWAE